MKTASATADMKLVHAAPLTVRRVVYVGGDFEAFASSYLRRNPNAALEAGVSSQSGGSDTELLIAASEPDLQAILDAAPSFPEHCAIVARLATGHGYSRQSLAQRGLALAKALRDERGEVWVIVPAAAAQARLHVELWAFAPMLMDVRTRLPTQQLGTDPSVRARWHVPPFELPDLPIDTPKVVVTQRPGRYPEPYLRNWVAETLARGWLPVLETDDHPGLIAAVDGQPGEPNWLSAKAMLAVQTSTEKLATAFAAHNPEVRVFPNAVFELPPLPEARRPRRVFYGAVSRGPFAVDVARSLAPTIRQFPDVEFVVVGDQAVFDALPTRRKRFEGLVPYEQYLRMLRSCSVILSPLAGRPFEDTKSDAKYLDAAQAGALMIASPTVYGDVIQHGVTGMIARRMQDWAPLLAEALRNEPKRREMAGRAWAQVREGRMFADQIAQRRDWYLELWERRDELERAAYERVAGLAEAVEQLRR